MSSSTWPTSRMLGTSTRTFLFIDDGSISTWILRAFGENAFSRPVMLSSHRAPILTMSSPSFFPFFSSYYPFLPFFPSLFFFSLFLFFFLFFFFSFFFFFFLFFFFFFFFFF